MANFNIPPKVTYIGKEAFAGCPGPNYIVIPSEVTYIGKCAFDCKNLTKVRIEEGSTPLEGGVACFPYVKEAVINKSTKSTSGAIFVNPSENPFVAHLENVSIGNGCSSIGYGLFAYCARVTSINLPNSITSIGESAFYGCTGLTSISIPPKVKEIYGSMVAQCTNLENISFQGPVPQIIPNNDGVIFDGCDKLVSVSLSTGEGWKNLPQDRFVKVTFLDNYVETDITYWKNWTKLEYLVSFSAIPPKIGDSFSEFQKWNVRVRVPSSSLTTYQNTPVWKDFYFLNGGAETLGITDVETEDENSVKCPIYDLNGVRVDNPVPGHVYIRNGKKYVIGRH